MFGDPSRHGLLLWRGIAVCMVIIAVAQAAPAQAPNLEAMDIVLRSIPDGPVAKVFGENIAKADFVALYQTELARVMHANQRRDIPDGARVQLGLLVLETLIQHELLYREAQIRQLDIPDNEVERAYEQAMSQAQRATKELEKREMSEEELIERMGYASRKDLLKEIERTLLIREMRDILVDEAEVELSDEEIAQAYEQYRDQFSKPGTLHIRQIFVNAREGDSESAQRQREQARKNIEDALMLIRSGQRFESVVREYSQSPDKRNGGELGPAAEASFPKYLVDAAKQLKPGEISGIIESEIGFHILQLIEYSPGASATKVEAETAIRRELLRDQQDEIVREYCEAIASNSREVKIFLELEKNLPPELQIR